MTREEKIEELVNNRDALVKFLYTPWRSILPEMEIREADLNLQNYLSEILPTNTPEKLLSEKNMVLTRHIATPNYEMHRFMQFSDVITGLQPVVLEYSADKYVSVNTTKRALTELSFYKGRKGQQQEKTDTEKVVVVDRASREGLPLNEIKTTSGTPLEDLHHSLFHTTFPGMENSHFDVSDMHKSLGGGAKFYYKGHLSLFLKNNVLFENFLLNKEETGFLKGVILPTIFQIIDETGHKPLIVNLGPTGNEEDIFWVSYPPNNKETVNKFLGLGS